MTPKINQQLEQVAKALMETVDGVLQGSGKINYTQDPEIISKDIIEYKSRMRVFGMEKFNGQCYVAYVNFYKSPAEQAAKNASGALVIFAEGDNAGKLLKTLGYRVSGDEEPEEVMQQLSELCKSIAQKLMAKISSLGYSGLIMSEPAAAENDVAAGVDFNYDEYQLYEISFYVWKQKIFVANVSLAPA